MLAQLPSDATITPKLLMHMDPIDQEEGTNAFTVAHQLGLTPDKVLLPQEWFRKGGMPLVTEAGLNEIYNSTDVFLTCSLGEGWGLPISTDFASDSILVAIELEREFPKERTGITPLSQNWLSWDRVAQELLNIMK